MKWPTAGTGILTKFVPTFDGDILNAEAAAAVEKLVRKRIGKRGKILKRIGLAPKFAIPFRTDQPFAKISVKLIPPGMADDDPKLKSKLEGPEFLCDGQQFVAFGIRPITGEPYRWNGAGMPGNKVKRKELPSVNADEARQILDAAAELLIKDHGYRRGR